jgi:uncharacterized protein (TIGR02466 family)
MSLVGLFATPIFENITKPSQLSFIQNEFNFVVDDLKKKDSFQHNLHWAPNTQAISDITFTKNLIEEYNLDSFSAELNLNIEQFIKMLGAGHLMGRKYKIFQSWLTLTKQNEYSHIHNHGDYDIAGVYYYQTNGKDGDIWFKNPTMIHNTYFLGHLPQYRNISPEVGKFILFPGWLEHGVQTNTTTNERISFSFNIKFQRDF